VPKASQCDCLECLVFVASSLLNAANEIGNLKDSTPLRDFFQWVNFRKGRISAISATARKLAVIIWNLVVKNTPYINQEGYLLLDRKENRGQQKDKK
jgi:transposase